MMKNKDLLLSFLIYGAGLASLLFIDVYISITFDESQVVWWAGLKSIVFLAGSMSLLGFEQVLVRRPNSIKKSYFMLVVQVLSVAFFVSLLVFFLEGYEFLLVYMCVALFALNQLNYSAFRARRQFSYAQLSTNFWKVVFLVLLVCFSDIGLGLLASLALIFFVGGYFLKVSLVASMKDKGKDKGARAEAIAFLLHNLTLISAIYGEQLILNFLGEKEASYIVFTHMAFLAPIALSINGFIGFYLSPKLRSLERFTIALYRQMMIKLALFSLFVTVLSFYIGSNFFVYFKGGNEYILSISITISVMCFIRGCYILSSSVLGVFGTKELLYRTAALNWVALFLYIASIVITSLMYDGVYVAISVILLSMVHWILRLLISQFYSIKILTK